MMPLAYFQLITHYKMNTLNHCTSYMTLPTYLKISEIIGAPKNVRLLLSKILTVKKQQMEMVGFNEIYKMEHNNIVKMTKLDFQTLLPNNFEKQKVCLVVNIHDMNNLSRV